MSASAKPAGGRSRNDPRNLRSTCTTSCTTAGGKAAPNCLWIAAASCSSPAAAIAIRDCRRTSPQLRAALALCFLAPPPPSALCWLQRPACRDQLSPLLPRVVSYKLSESSAKSSTAAAVRLLGSPTRRCWPRPKRKAKSEGRGRGWRLRGHHGPRQPPRASAPGRGIAGRRSWLRRRAPAPRAGQR